MSLILPFIMCGGSGTRMWPVSRESLPKQFIPLLDERSTFQTTLAMLARPELFTPPTVITNRDYRFLVGEQMQSVGVTGDIVLEPMRRDSGPAVAVAAELAFRRSPDSVVAMLAAKLALEIAEVDASMIPLLDQKAQQALYTAQAEERDNSPMMIAPNISMYTR